MMHISSLDEHSARVESFIPKNEGRDDSDLPRRKDHIETNLGY